jgi:hypothetical protein
VGLFPPVDFCAVCLVRAMVVLVGARVCVQLFRLFVQ